LLFAVAAAPEIAFLDARIPIVYSADSTFAAVRHYYPRYTNVLAISAREADYIDSLGLRKAALLAFPSEWAAQSAVRDYHVDESRVHVIPYGANLEEAPAREDALRPRPSGECRLLFVGVKWERKGGQIAVETLNKLRAVGVPAELTICGCVPPREFQAPGLTVIPFLNKNDPAQRKKLEDLYLASHFLLLPSRSECYGIAFCEANAFGLPVVTTRTGGIPQVVREGRNGFMLPLSAGGSEYAELIARIWQDQASYSELTRSSRQEFEERLNWDAWATSVGKLLPRVLHFSTGSVQA
jgi:glycosyltransferase involved in cell wall biosynthesis